MLLRIAKKSIFLQNIIINIISSIHPTISHNLSKIEMIKKAIWHCETEKIEGSYFEFGIFEGTSLLSAAKIHQKINSKMNRNFYGFDSFEEGFKYFDENDRHPYFKEGDFVSSYNKTRKRFRKYENVKLVKGYFEEIFVNKKTSEICGEDKCAVVFIDCDLMNPALISLEFVKPILQDGTIIILDDYWAYKGNPELGTSGAFRTFLQNNPGIKVRQYNTYGYGGMSFVVYKV